MDLGAFRKGLDDWLGQHEAELTPDHDGRGTLDEHMEQLAKVKRAGFEAGWMRWGWPERVGGLGGSHYPAGLSRRGAHGPQIWSNPAATR